MNQECLNRIAKQIMDVAAQAHPIDDHPPDIAKALFREGKGYSLNKKADAILNKVIETALRFWSDKYSEEYIRKRINNAVSLSIKNRNPTSAKEILTLLASEFDALHQEQIVYLPVFGLSLPMGELRIGNVIIYPGDGKKKHELLETFISVVRKTSGPPEKQDAVIARLRISIEEAFKTHSIAEFKVIAEPKRAIERAEEEVRRALEALRFAIPFLSAPERKIAIGLPDDAFRIITSAFVVSDTSFNITTSVVSGLMPFEISSECFDNMKKIGVFALSELLQKSGTSLSDFEKALLSSVHWFSTAQLQPEIESGYLALITSIEVLLAPRDGSPIATSIAEALALLLGDNLEDRRYIKRYFKELYSKRSAVSHGGDKAILDTDYKSLVHFAMQLIQRLITRRIEFASRGDLLTHIEDLKLS
jgi:hypothetical protein